jgi:hypothetical protein
MTLIILQGLFLALWYTNFNFLGIVSWIGKGDSYNSFKLFAPLIAFGAIKILYWFADPLSKLFTIILNWVVLVGICYGLYWIFFV